MSRSEELERDMGRPRVMVMRVGQGTAGGRVTRHAGAPLVRDLSIWRWRAPVELESSTPFDLVMRSKVGSTWVDYLAGAIESL